MSGGVPGRGGSDLAARVEELERHLVPELRPLARVAYNYRWTWVRGGPSVFAAIDSHRWRLARQNPVRFLLELPRDQQRATARRSELVGYIGHLAGKVAPEPRPESEPRLRFSGPIAFLCAEFGVHVSLPIYAGGLGVLAGDFLKEASDRGLPLIGIGLFYRRGYFCQRLDLSGWQQEYWLEQDPELLPLALVQDEEGTPLRLSVNLFGAPLAFQVWQAQVGSVPLLLLDAELSENDAVRRWTTARLYDGNARIRLAQYGLLGMGGAAVLEALGIEPAVLHLNEGHPALAPLELASRDVQRGVPLEQALERIRERVVFTTHTPLQAGNESYPADLFLGAFQDLAGRLGLEREAFLDLCRTRPGDGGEQPGMSPLGMRIASRRNGVSRQHGEVARGMWRPMFPDGPVPIDHVTNGAHLATFLSDPLWRLFVKHLGEPWLRNPADAGAWEAVRRIPNAELWRARSDARRQLVEYVRERGEQDRLLRGEEIDYVRAGSRSLDPDRLTFGFARRLTGYKRLSLLVADPERARAILLGPSPVQVLIAGKAHPSDTEGKHLLQRVFWMRRQIDPAGTRVVFLEDYDLTCASALVGGCDVWLNVPQRGLEASGTSGMKSTFNGGLQVSVLEGWWAESYNEANGWAIPADDDPDPGRADARDAEALYSLVENEVIPLFYERDDDGVPHRWCERIKEALVSLGPALTATRMLDDYVARVYGREPDAAVRDALERELAL
jgi:glycogen phosphorylase